MAGAPGHRLGQIIGNELEACVEPLLQDFADQHGIYLDKKGPRPARPGKKVRWVDDLRNAHELDYVLERGGSADKVGVPVAFIETAWRRYTKHSRNKAQEIQAAVSALVHTHGSVRPFAGVVLAGVFTDGSLDQLRSNGFAVVYVRYQTIVDIFRIFGVDVYFDESTPDGHVLQQIDLYKQLDGMQREALRASLRQAVSDQLEHFRAALKRTVLRHVESVSVIPLHGKLQAFDGIGSAIDMILGYAASGPAELPLLRFEVVIRYSNGDRIVADFEHAEDTVGFLRSYL
jgi:hypothetical protein